MMHVVHMCACGACMYIYAHMFLVVHVCVKISSMHMCVWWCMYVHMVHIYAPLIGHAYMCMWCIYAHMYVFGGACSACMCTWCMYVYMVHL